MKVSEQGRLTIIAIALRNRHLFISRAFAESRNVYPWLTRNQFDAAIETGHTSFRNGFALAKS